MGPNMFLMEKLSEAHRQELLREAERERLLAQLPRHRWSVGRHVAAKLGVLLLKLGTRLKQFEQKAPTVLENRP